MAIEGNGFLPIKLPSGNSVFQQPNGADTLLPFRTLGLAGLIGWFSAQMVDLVAELRSLETEGFGILHLAETWVEQTKDEYWTSLFTNSTDIIRRRGLQVPSATEAPT